jgi:cytochrome c oxidase subunit 2
MKFLFQDPASVVMEGIINMHHNVQFYLIIILVFVGWLLTSIVVEYGLSLRVQSGDIKELVLNRRLVLDLMNVTHGKTLEIVWTIIPSVVLVFIAVPSFALLYSLDELIDPSLTLKVVGHQWYWSYEYSDYEEGDLAFDSYMVSEEDLEEGDLRLLEVDRKVWLPTNTHIRVLVTAADVLHCWAIPSLGIKMDAVPGRLNQVSMFIKREGVFFGQCSELCGVNHGFMPIAIKAVGVDLFNYWVDFNLEN